jgi:BlaI family penicillinase repressor
MADEVIIMIKLTEAEWDIMKILWDKKELCLADIVKAAQENGNSWATNTVHTLLGRLIKKQALEVNKTVSPHIYYPIADREACSLDKTKKLIEQIYDGSLSRMVSAFLSSEKVSDKELDELRKIVNNIKPSGGHNDEVD